MNSKTFVASVYSLLLAVLLFGEQSLAEEFSRPDPLKHPDVFGWKDTCNVWLIRNGDTAILIDLGDGSVLDHLSEIGVNRIEWVLFTHHHREQCQGASKLQAWNVQTAAPRSEQSFFENPLNYRKMQVRLQDPFTIHGSSYVRPPIEPIPIDRAFEKMDSFVWREKEFWCIETRGNSPGSMSYLLRTEEGWLAFTGDLMLDGAKLHTWYDSEWDYGFAAGVWALSNSAAQVAGYDPRWLLPSHGPPIREPAEQLTAFQEKLQRFEKLLIRGYPVLTFSSTHQDRVSKPTRVPHVWQVAPHIYKFRGPDYFPNFYLIISENGHALAIDCGSLNSEHLDPAIVGMRQFMGLKQIDAVIPTHMHGDHMGLIPHLRQQWGAEVWGLDRMAEVCEHPERFDYAAPIQAYGRGIEGIRFDRELKDGERLHWEGYDLTVDWMPGQTEFALCVQGIIDGKRVAFTGDNIFGDPFDSMQNGHEAVVAHNSAILEEGYIHGAEYLARIQPDLILGGHSYVMPEPTSFIERYRQWSYSMRDAFRELIDEKDYRYGFDPFWVRAYPYRSTIRRGQTADLTIHVRNFLNREQLQRLAFRASSGLSVIPSFLELRLPAHSRQAIAISVEVSATATSGIKLIAIDLTRDTTRDGERFDAIVQVVP